MPVLAVALLMTAKIQSQPRLPIYKQGDKKNVVQVPSGVLGSYRERKQNREKLEDIVRSQIHQKQKDLCPHVHSHLWDSPRSQQERNMVMAGCWEGTQVRGGCKKGYSDW